jgi:hypothetical protein
MTRAEAGLAGNRLFLLLAAATNGLLNPIRLGLMSFSAIGTVGKASG